MRGSRMRSSLNNLALVQVLLPQTKYPDSNIFL